MSQNFQTQIKFAPTGYASFFSALIAKPRAGTIAQNEDGTTTLVTAACPDPAPLTPHSSRLALLQIAFAPLFLAFLLTKPVHGLGAATASFTLAFSIALIYALPHTRSYMPAKAIIFALSLLGLYTIYHVVNGGILSLLTVSNAVAWVMVFSVANPIAQKMHENFHLLKDRDIYVWWAKEPYSFARSALVATALMVPIIALSYLF
jgi:hypothetical protein